MKLLFSLLSLILTISFVKTQQFANFIPYTSDTCKGSSIGIGYSIPIEQCVSIGESDILSWKITESNFGTFVLVQYREEFNCSDSNIISNTDLTPGCMLTPDFMQYDNFTIKGIPSNSQFSHFSVDSTPIYAAGSLVEESHSVLSGDDCDDSNVLFAVTYSEKIEIDYQDGSSDTYYCKDGEAYQNHCFTPSKCGSQDITCGCDSRCVGHSIVRCN